MIASAVASPRKGQIVAALEPILPREATWPGSPGEPITARDHGLHAYVKADPVNFTDPSGLEQLGLFCDGGSCADIGITAGGSSEVGYYHGIRLGSGAGGKFLPRMIGEGAGAVARRLGDALDKFAEDNLKPPEDRKTDESQQQCFKRLTGLSPALAVAGGFNIAAGGAWLGYARGTLSRGGGGTSLISSAARGALGDVHMGRGVLGTGSLGGALGRGLSKASVITGAAALGWAAGTIAGAAQKCQ